MESIQARMEYLAGWLERTQKDAYRNLNRMKRNGGGGKAGGKGDADNNAKQQRREAMEHSQTRENTPYWAEVRGMARPAAPGSPSAAPPAHARRRAKAPPRRLF